MSVTSLKGGRCEDRGAVGGLEGGRALGAGSGGVTPWAAGVYEKVKAFELDQRGDAFPFSARLASENGWSRGYTLRVIEEYRRFVCLMATAPHPVTPSEAVDQAWHLHMTYTRSYWDGLCGRVVGRPLHHDPTRGGSSESAKFHDWYARTLETYRRAFGNEPSCDIWPSTADRFAGSKMQWVDLAVYRLVPRRTARRSWLGWLGLGSVGAAAAGCGGSNAAVGLLILLGVIVAVVVIGSAVKAAASPTQGARRARRRRSGGAFDDGVSWTPGLFTGDDTPGHHHGHHSSDGGGDSHGHGHDGGHGCSSGYDGGGDGCSSGDSGGGCGGGDSGGGCGGGGCGGGGCGGGGD